METIRETLEGYGVHEEWIVYLTPALMILFVAALCIIANFIAKKIVIRLIARIIKRNKIQWDNVFLERKVFHRLSHIVPAIIIYLFADSFPEYRQWIEKGVNIYVILIAMMVLVGFMNALHDIYRTFEVSKVKPIRGFIQVANIIIVVVGSIIIVSSLIGESPLILLSGIGALSAVLLLIFQDSILGLVAGVQLTANDLVRVGDWIEMPKYGADGEVVDVLLNTVKVQNWDKTITTIPAYAMISDSFKNWRGMETAGGRRIKRSIYLDQTSVKFCSEEMIERLKKVHYLTDYIVEKQREITEYNEKNRIDRTIRVNGRAMTNIGVFRAYITNYLRNHPGINQNMTLMVRQLAPGEHGIPLEIYCFTKDTRWVVYEGVQSDIFDHLLAIIPEFELRVFQNPSGHDLKTMMAQTE